MKKPNVLLILDGWGEAGPSEYNSITRAMAPTYKKIEELYPKTLLNASGPFVGLPEGQMGNSEVGHLNIGSGRVVYQDLTKIDKAISDGDFYANEVFKEYILKAVRGNKNIHLWGLVSDGGVHSHISHIEALVVLCKKLGAKEVYLHGVLDGRDVPPKSAGVYIARMEKFFKAEGIGGIATLAGRYYSMDRDKRYERLQKGYNAMCFGEGEVAKSPMEALDKSYARGETDEFLLPTIIEQDGQKNLVEDGDTVISFNFRSDRAREMTYAFAKKDFSEFPTKKMTVNYVAMTEYDEHVVVPVAFPKEALENTLGKYISKEGLRQARIAETEKYAHVTFFFNGGVEDSNQGEERILVASPKVATYDLKPEMSLPEVTTKVLEALKSDSFDLLIVNLANGDMVGHTGIIEASVKAVEAVDKALEVIVAEVLKRDGKLLLTADHGNCETMIDEHTGKPLTSHTTNLVPFFLISNQGKNISLRQEGGLALRDISPTILDILDLPIPKEMTGKSLIIKDK